MRRQVVQRDASGPKREKRPDSVHLGLDPADRCVFQDPDKLFSDGEVSWSRRVCVRAFMYRQDLEDGALAEIASFF